MEYLQDPTTPNICLSGGADGADLEWGRCASLLSHRVIHWSFNGHKSKACDDQIVRLTDDQLKLGNDAIAAAARALSKSPPRKPHVEHLLQRNYYQVAWSRACYAVTFLDGVGGTSWATTMFRQLHPESRELYLFCQERGTWFQWNGKEWIEIEYPPRPSGVWAGIGARNLMDNGRDAIRRVMGVDENGNEVRAGF